MATTSQDKPGQAVIRFEFEVPGGNLVAFNSSQVTHVRSVLHDTVYGAGMYTHTFTSSTRDYVDNVLKQVMALGTGRLRMHLGVGTPDSVFWLPWHEQVIIDYAANPEGIGNQSGHTFNIITSDLLRLLQRGQRIASHRGTVSSIVQASLELFKLTDHVIEVTQGSGLYVQPLISDEMFIRQRMLPRALSTNGHGGYYFFCRDNVVHFHSQGYQGNVHEVTYYQANNDILTQNDQSQALLEEGDSGASVIVYDPFTGKAAEYESDADKALKLSQTVYDLASIPYASRTFGYHASSNPVDEAQVIMQNTYERARRRTYAVSVRLTKTIGIRHGDLMRLILAPKKDQASPWSGLYYVAEVNTTVETGEVHTSYVLERGEIEAARRQTVSEITGAQLINELDARGSQINLAEFQSSDQTKGGSNFNSDTIFRNVSDPDSSA